MSNLTSLTLHGGLSARSGVEPIDPSEVPSFVAVNILQEKFQLATITVLAYDALITFDKEFKYFWKVPRKAVDFVFFLNRYVGILGAVVYLFYDTFQADFALCNFAFWARDIADWVTFTSIDYILTIRVLALYSKDHRLSAFLMVLLAVDALLKLGVMMYLRISEHTAVGGLAKNVTICGVDNVPPWQLGMADWLIPLVYGTILMVLALRKAAQFWKMSTGLKGFRLVKVLIRDQVWYFSLVILCSVFSILEFKVGVSNYVLAGVLNQLGNPSLLTILGSRLLFNMKEAAELGLNEGTNCNIQSGTISDIAFTRPVNPKWRSQTDVEETMVEA